MIELGGLLLAGVLGLALVVLVTALVAVAAAVQALLWIVLLPVRIIFWAFAALLFLPLLLLKLIVGGLLLVLALPFIIAAVLLAGVAALLGGLLVPLLPLAVVGAFVWYLMRPESTGLVPGG